MARYRRYMYPGSGTPRGDYTIESSPNGKYKSIKLASTGRMFSFHDAERQVEKGLNMVTRWMSRISQIVPETGDSELDDYYWEKIDEFCERLEIIAARWREEVAKHHVRRSKEKRIAALRNVTGRFPEEAELFLARADELEQEL